MPFDDGKTTSGEATEDKIFLLSLEEIYKYFKQGSDRGAEATAYAEAQGVYIEKNGNADWWTRTSLWKEMSAYYIHDEGVISYYTSLIAGVRPAMWITIEE